MANGFEFFERDLRLATAGLEPTEVNRALATFAKQELRAVIASGRASTSYERYVNGVQGAPEEAVTAPGPIVYQFVNWPIVIRETLEELRKRAPRKSGRYAGGFMVLVGGRAALEYKSIPATAEVVILNVRPYTRKIESGANKTGKRHMEQSKNVLARRYRDAFSFDFKFLDVSAGVHADVPYILKRGSKLRRAAQNRQSPAFRAGEEFLSRRKDRQAGQPITYPSIIINAT